ncbi:MAG: DUF3301 domain-containing protein [Pseudomonadales bacterium]|nr:DUF3301 domain-containing protein [Pseudomonadales bacterium]
MFDLHDVILGFAALALLTYWWRISGQKLLALNTARRYCQQQGLQFLDESLVFKGFQLRRDPRNRLRLYRNYEFDFATDGMLRYQGSIQLSGQSIIRIVLEAEQTEVMDFLP